MKYRNIALGVILLAVLTLTGCACEHEWVAADCLNPQTCAKCNEVGEPALGHDWLDATCTVPETCTRCSETKGEPLAHEWLDATCTAPETCARCSETQGEALAHTYGEWSFTDALMAHTCTVCNYLEELPIDHQLYLEHILSGYWNFSGVSTDEAFVSAEDYIMTDPAYNSYIHFGPDKSCRVVMGIAKMEPFDSTWTYVDHLEQNGIAYYYISVPYDGGTFVFMITRTASGQHSIIYVVDIHTTVTFTQNADTAESLSGCWGIAKNKWGSYLGDCSYWLQFNPDRTVAGNINGSFEGIWHPVDIGYATYTGILIEYDEDGETEYLRGTYYVQEDNFYLLSETERFPFQKLNNAEASVIQNCTNLLLGSWTSVYKQDDHYQKEYSSTYSIDFLEDGSFTADINGRKHKGTWTVDGYHFTEECANEAIPYRPRYTLDLYFDGQKKSVYCHLDAGPGPQDITLRINADYPNSDGKSLYFLMLDEDESTAYQAGPTLPVGTWSESGTHLDASGAMEANEHYLTFHDDGTFTGMLDGEIHGTWEFTRYYKDTYYTSSGSYEQDNWSYGLYPEGNSNFISFYIEGSDDIKLYIRTQAGTSYYLKSYETELKQPFFQQEVDYADPNAQVIVGKWAAIEMLKFDKTDSTPIPEATSGEYYLTFFEDGTFSGKLLEEVSGKWKPDGSGTQVHRFELLFANGTASASLYSGPEITYMDVSMDAPDDPNGYYSFHLWPEQ